MPTELSEDVWRFDLGNVNAYFVNDGTKTLIDAGTGSGGEKIRRELREIGTGVREIDQILITHYDIDHVGGLSKLEKDLDAEIYMGEKDAPLLRGEKPSMFNLKGAFQRIGNIFFSLPDIDVKDIADGEEVNGFSVYYTPGHTPGHIVFVHEDKEVAFLGDLVRESDGEFKASPWFLSHDTGNVKESIKELVERVPEFEIGCPGHGEPITSGADEKLRKLAESL